MVCYTCCGTDLMMSHSAHEPPYRSPRLALLFLPIVLIQQILYLKVTYGWKQNTSKLSIVAIGLAVYVFACTCTYISYLCKDGSSILRSSKVHSCCRRYLYMAGVNLTVVWCSMRGREMLLPYRYMHLCYSSIHCALLIEKRLLSVVSKHSLATCTCACDTVWLLTLALHPCTCTYCHISSWPALCQRNGSR